MTVPRALSIATSDSGGGAGMQADLKAFAAAGAHGMSVLVALTAQNTTAVNAIHELPPAFVVEQLDAVFGDIGDGERVPCRIHREQPVVDLFTRSQAARAWLDIAVDEFARRGRGVLVFLRNPVADDLLAAERAAGAAEQAAGLADGEAHGSARLRTQRWREIGVGAQILRHLGVRSIVLLATREQRYVGLGGFGIEIAETLRVED